MEIISPSRARAKAENELMAIDQNDRRNALMGAQTRREDQRFAFDQRQQEMAVQRAQQEREAAAEAESVDWIKNAIGYARQNPQAIPALMRQAKQRGLVPAEIPDALSPQELDQLAMHYGVEAPKAAPQMQITEGPFGSRIVQQGSRFQVVEPPKPTGQASQTVPKFRVATTDEVASAGLPEGSVAQVGVDGAMKILRQPGAQEMRERETARRFLPRIDALGRRVERVATAVDTIGKNRFINTGPVDKFVSQFTKEGQELEQSVLQAQSELQALTRIPGIGSQSDWEGRMQMLTWPSVEFAPEVNQRAIQEIRRFEQDLKAAIYGVAGKSRQNEQRGASGSFEEKPAQRRTKYDANGNRVE